MTRLGRRIGYDWVFTRDRNARVGGGDTPPTTDLGILAADPACVAVFLADPSTMFVGGVPATGGGPIDTWVDSAVPSRVATQFGPTSQRPTRAASASAIIFDGVDDSFFAQHIATAVSTTQRATVITTQVADPLSGARCVFGLGFTGSPTTDFVRFGQSTSNTIRNVLFRNSAGTNTPIGVNTLGTPGAPYASRDRIRLNPSGLIEIDSAPSLTSASVAHPGPPTVHDLCSFGSFRTGTANNTAFFGGSLHAIIVFNTDTPAAASLTAAANLLNARGFP